MLQYNIVTGKNGTVRRSNRQSFLDRAIQTEWDEKISLLMLCYNHIDQFFTALDRVDREPRRKNFVITIVQNSDQDDAKKAFEERISSYKNINVLYPKHNLGSAWGYALGQEYILSRWYSHLIMLEDDVDLYDDDTISATIDAIEHDKQVLFINAPVNTDGDHSRYVQYACYPTSLLGQAGIIDPRFYFRAEDLEWRVRVENAIKTYHYTKTIVERNYFHPYLKGANNSGSRIYFSLRNQLWMFHKHRQWFLQFSLILAQYIAYGFLTFLRSGKLLIVACIWHAIIDGTGKYKPLEYHGEMIRYFWEFKKVMVKDIGFKSKEVWFEALEEWMNIRNIIARTSLAWWDRVHLSAYSGSLVTSGWLQPVWMNFIACLQKLLVIEHLNRHKKELQGKILSQWIFSQLINILLFLPCVLLWLASSLVASLRILCSTLLRK